MSNRVTIKDVAERANVSRAAVSAVLSDKDGKNIRVSPEKKDEIIRAARALGYVPNAVAQYLKSGDNNHIISVFSYEKVSPFNTNSEYYLFFSGIESEAEKNGYDLLLLNSFAKEKKRSTRIRLSSGAIMIGVDRDDEHINSLIKQGFPLVFVGRRDIKGLENLHYVTFDYKSAVYGILEKLKKIGSKISYVSSDSYISEPSIDKSSFLHQGAEELCLEITDYKVKDLSEAEFLKISESGIIVFDRIFLIDLFTPYFNKFNMEVGKDIFGAVLEDDWPGGHEDWLRWENRRMELGSLAVKHLVSLHSSSVLPNSLIDIPLIDAKSALKD